MYPTNDLQFIKPRVKKPNTPKKTQNPTATQQMVDDGENDYYTLKRILKRL